MTVADLLARDRYAARLGVVLVAAEDHRIVLELDVEDRHHDRFGRLSTGMLFSLADCAMSLASNADGTAVAVTAHLVRPPNGPVPSRLRAEATPLASAGGPAVTWQVLVRDGATVVAIFTGTTLKIS